MSDEGIQEQYVELLRGSGSAETYRAGEPIFREGDPADHMYLVDSGTVSLHVGEHVVETVGPSGLFGEMAVVDRRPRSASAIAESDCALITFDKRRFWFLVQETPFFRRGRDARDGGPDPEYQPSFDVGPGASLEELARDKATAPPTVRVPRRTMENRSV